MTVQIGTTLDVTFNEFKSRFDSASRQNKIHAYMTSPQRLKINGGSIILSSIAGEEMRFVCETTGKIISASIRIRLRSTQNITHRQRALQILNQSLKALSPDSATEVRSALKLEDPTLNLEGLSDWTEREAQRWQHHLCLLQKKLQH